MADGESSRPVLSEKTPDVAELGEFKLFSFQHDEQIDLFAKTQRKRIAKRSFQDYGLTTLSLTKDPATRIKKRNRKDDKRFVVDRVDRFTFVSAFTLNDFDEYDKVPVKHSLVPTKRKSTSKCESTTSKKKVRKAVDAPQETLETLGAQDVRQGNSTPKNKEAPCDPSNSNLGKKKNVSPLTKSALVRLKKINVSNLKSPKNKKVIDTKDCRKECNKKNTMGGKVKKSLKEPKNKSGRPVYPNNRSQKKPMKLVVPHMEIDRSTIGEADSFDGHLEAAEISVSEDEDSSELDVCGVDENSSSQFINLFSNKTDDPEEKTSSSCPHEDDAKPKRKPCRVCCSYPCRIVGAKRIKSRNNQFPTFDVSFTSRCQVHTPGEIVVGKNSSKDKVNVCIQTTSTDIKMHLDFAKRFPYRAISIVSCQPSLYDDDLKLSDTLVTGTNQRCSENHRVLEQKRRSELHGLYCKLADTLSISKNRASKQWILENALKEVKCLEAKDKLLTAKLNLAKAENEERKKRWEELAGKPYVAPEESFDKVARKSKLLELYEIFRQEREEFENLPEDLKSEQGESKSVTKEQNGKSEEREKVINKLHKRIKSSTKGYSDMMKAKRLDAICDISKKNIAVKSNNLAMKPTSTRSYSDLKKARRLDAICDISKKNLAHSYSTSSYSEPKFGTFLTSTNDIVKSSNLAVEPNWTNLGKNPSITGPHTRAESNNSMPVNSSQIIHNHPKHTQLIAGKHESLGPRQNVQLSQHKPTSHQSPSAPIIDLTNESESSKAATDQSESSTPKSNQSPSSPSTSNQSGTSAINTNQIRKLSYLHHANRTTQVSELVLSSPPPTQSSALHGTTSSTSPTTQGLVYSNAMFPTPSPPRLNNPTPVAPSNVDFVIVTMVVKGKTTIFRIPKTADGLTLLSKLASMKKLSSDSFAKISAQFLLNQPSGKATTTIVQASSAGVVASTPSSTRHVGNTSVTPTQWSSAVATAPTPTLFTSKPVTRPTATQAVNMNVNTSSREVKQPVTSVVANTSIRTTSQPDSAAVKNNSTSFATISRPIKIPTGSQAVKTSSENTVNLSNLNNNILRNSNVAMTGQQFIANGKPKLTFLDFTNKSKSPSIAFPVTPTSQSINVTLNKLGSITGNKVFNTPPKANIPPTKLPAPKPTQRDEYQLYRNAPILIIPKSVASTSSHTPFTTVDVHPVSIPPEAPPGDLPEIPPDIPSELTEASLSPLEAIPVISDSLLEGSCQNHENSQDDSGICVISNVFSLTETAGCGTSKPDVNGTSEVDQRNSASI